MAINFPNSPITGQSIYVNGTRFVYNGFAWARAIISANVGSRRPRNYTSAQGQTVFITDLDLTNFEVFLNGLKLAASDYSANAGVLTLLEGLTVGDNLEVIEYGSYDVLKDIYSTQTLAPSNVNVGYIWYDKNTNEVKVYTPTGWQVLSNNTSYNKETYTATAGQTVFNIAHTIGFVSVYFNGLKLSSDEYTSNGTSVTLNVGAAVGDIIDLVGFTNFTLSNAYTKEKIDSMIVEETTTVIYASTNTVIDMFPKAMYRSAEYLISYKDTTNNLMGSTKLLVHHNNVTADFVEYATLGDNLATLTFVINGADVQLVANTINPNIRFIFTRIQTVE
jgi:hypothetical protein